jgi:hypothetical protein
MLGYSLDLLVQLPRLLSKSFSEFEGAAMLVAFLLILLNRPIFKSLGKRILGWEGISKWWALIPVALLFGYASLQATYEKYETVVNKLDKLERKLSTLEIDVKPVAVPETGERFRVSVYEEQEVIETEFVFKVENTSEVPLVIQIWTTEMKQKNPASTLSITPAVMDLGPGHHDFVRIVSNVFPSRIQTPETNDPETIEGWIADFSRGIYRLQLRFGVQYFARGAKECAIWDLQLEYWTRGDRLELHDRWREKKKAAVCIHRLNRDGLDPLRRHKDALALEPLSTEELRPEIAEGSKR